MEMPKSWKRFIRYPFLRKVVWFKTIDLRWFTISICRTKAINLAQ